MQRQEICNDFRLNYGSTCYIPRCSSSANLRDMWNKSDTDTTQNHTSIESRSIIDFSRFGDALCKNTQERWVYIASVHVIWCNSLVNLASSIVYICVWSWLYQRCIVVVYIMFSSHINSSIITHLIDISSPQILQKVCVHSAELCKPETHICTAHCILYTTYAWSTPEFYSDDIVFVLTAWLCTPLLHTSAACLTTTSIHGDYRPYALYSKHNQLFYSQQINVTLTVHF